MSTMSYYLPEIENRFIKGGPWALSEDEKSIVTNKLGEIVKKLSDKKIAVLAEYWRAVAKVDEEQQQLERELEQEKSNYCPNSKKSRRKRLKQRFFGCFGGCVSKDPVLVDIERRNWYLDDITSSVKNDIDREYNAKFVATVPIITFNEPEHLPSFREGMFHLPSFRELTSIKLHPSTFEEPEQTFVDPPFPYKEPELPLCPSIFEEPEETFVDPPFLYNEPELPTPDQSPEIVSEMDHSAITEFDENIEFIFEEPEPELPLCPSIFEEPEETFVDPPFPYNEPELPTPDQSPEIVSEMDHSAITEFDENIDFIFEEPEQRFVSGFIEFVDPPFPFNDPVLPTPDKSPEIVIEMDQSAITEFDESSEFIFEEPEHIPTIIEAMLNESDEFPITDPDLTNLNVSDMTEPIRHFDDEPEQSTDSETSVPSPPPSYSGPLTPDQTPNKSMTKSEIEVDWEFNEYEILPRTLTESEYNNILKRLEMLIESQNVDQIPDEELPGTPTSPSRTFELPTTPAQRLRDWQTLTLQSFSERQSRVQSLENQRERLILQMENQRERLRVESIESEAESNAPKNLSTIEELSESESPICSTPRNVKLVRLGGREVKLPTYETPPPSYSTLACTLYRDQACGEEDLPSYNAIFCDGAPKCTGNTPPCTPPGTPPSTPTTPPVNLFTLVIPALRRQTMPDFSHENDREELSDTEL